MPVSPIKVEARMVKVEGAWQLDWVVAKFEHAPDGEAEAGQGEILEAVQILGEVLFNGRSPDAQKPKAPQGPGC